MDNQVMGIQGYTACQINWLGATGIMGTYSSTAVFQQMVIPDLMKNLTEIQISLKTKGNLNSLETVEYIVSILKSKKRHRLLNNMLFAYTKKYNHVFLIFNDDLYSERCIIDLNAAQFGENDIVIKNVKDYVKDYAATAKPWWSYDKLYTKKASLIKYLRKNGWNIERKAELKLKLVTTGITDLKKSEIRVLPFDEDAKKFLQKHSKGAAGNTSIAKLLLSSSDKQIKKLVPIINNM